MSGPPAVVLLDALGTLVGIEPPWGPLRDGLAEHHGVVVAEADVVRALRAEMAYYRAHCQDAADAVSLARLRAACADVVADELGGAVAELDRAELTRTLLDSLRVAAYPEVADALRALRAGGARLIVVSNWDISLVDALAQAGLAGLVDDVVCSATVGTAKPSREIFAAALALAGLPADRALHVGDSYAEDVVGARAAAFVRVLLVRAAGRPGPPGAAPPPGDVRTIASLAELVEP